MYISYLKILCTQSFRHIKAFWAREIAQTSSHQPQSCVHFAWNTLYLPGWMLSCECYVTQGPQHLLGAGGSHSHYDNSINIAFSWRIREFHPKGLRQITIPV